MNERRRTLLFSGGYKIPTENGVYIESVEHKFYLTNDWDTTNTANSIAVVADVHKFRIALSGTKLSMSSSRFDSWDTYLSGTTNSGTTDKTVAKADYNGATNTHLIVTKCQSSTDYAAGWCNAYTFPDGSKGYLPSLGEMNLAYQNKAAVDAALAKCGGTALPMDNFHWSSRFYGSNGIVCRCWGFIWDSGTVIGNYLDTNFYVRPFAPLEYSN